jgi:hypothetical protein
VDGIQKLGIKMGMNLGLKMLCHSMKKFGKNEMNSKKKGNRSELYIANLLSERFGLTFKRVPASGAHGTNLAKTDIRQDAKEILSGDIICPQNFKFSIEVKSRANFNFWDLLNKEDTETDDWIKQAEEEAIISKKKMLLIVRANNRKPFAVINHIEGQITPGVRYKEYDIIRLDYLLAFGDGFFLS